MIRESYYFGVYIRVPCFRKLPFVATLKSQQLPGYYWRAFFAHHKLHQGMHVGPQPQASVAPRIPNCMMMSDDAATHRLEALNPKP